jgi:hypothetical protein
MYVRSQSLMGLPSYFLLREEAQKCWQHRISNEVVHIHKVFKGYKDPFDGVAKLHIYPRLWIECHLIFHSERNLHYVALIEPFYRHIETSGNVKNPISGSPANHNESVFVDIPEFVQSPEMREFVSIPTLIRLKLLHEGECGFRDSISRSNDLDLCLDRILVANREGDFLVGSVGSQSGELPNQVVETGSKAANKIACNHGEMKRERCNEFDLDDVPTTFHVLFSRNSMSLRLLESKKVTLKRIQVFLRPVELKVRVEDVSHGNGLYFGVVG